MQGGILTNDNHQNSGLDEAMSMGQKAAGAIKIAKAASEGAAAGGLWGAAIGAAIEGRKYIGKFAVAAVTFLLIPILFITMLPSLIFGGLTQSGAEGASLPVLNDAAAITDNLSNAAGAVSGILGEGIDDAKTRIATHFAATGADNYEIVNPYEEGIDSNVNLFLAEYCAAKNEAWSDMALSDMESILRSAKNQLYSFTYTTETREVDDDDPETEDVVETKVEKWYVYTLSYNGEAYLADNVFHLSDQQKSLADDYAKNLSLFLGDGAYQGPTASQPSRTIASLGSVTYTDGVTNVVYFNQYDERFANKPYGTDHVGGYGCGPSSMAIVVSSLTSDRMDPAQMAEWAYQHGYWCKGQGSYRSLIPGAAKAWGLNVEGCGKDEPQKIVDALSSGKLIVAIMSKGHFTSGGHFIVLRGVKDGKIMVADPASRSRSEKLWDLSLIVSEASNGRDSGGPFWLIG